LFTAVASLQTGASFCCKPRFHFFAQAPCVNKFRHRELLFPEQDKEITLMCQIMSLDTDVIPCLGADHAPDYLITI